MAAALHGKGGTARFGGRGPLTAADPAEAALIEASLQGDTRAFDKLIRRYEDRLYRRAKSVCARLPAEADDVYQETFLTAFKKLPAFRAESGLGTWLYRIASNLCWMKLRKERAKPYIPIPEQGHGSKEASEQLRDRSAGPEESARRKELRLAVSKALGLLAPDYRLVLTLCDVEELSARETGRILRLSIPAVKSRLHRGRRMLKDRLDAYLRGGAPSPK